MNEKQYELADDTINLTKEEREAKVYALEVELTEATIEKKSLVGSYNENIKRLKAEIKDLIQRDVQRENVN